MVRKPSQPTFLTSRHTHPPLQPPVQPLTPCMQRRMQHAGGHQVPCLSVPRALRCSPSGVPAKLPPALSLSGRELGSTGCLTRLEAGWLRNSRGQGQTVLKAPERLRSAVPPLAWQATPELLAESGATRIRPPLTPRSATRLCATLLAGRNALAASGNCTHLPTNGLLASCQPGAGAGWDLQLSCKLRGRAGMPHRAATLATPLWCNPSSLSSSPPMALLPPARQCLRGTRRLTRLRNPNKQHHEQHKAPTCWPPHQRIGVHVSVRLHQRAAL